MIYPETVGVLFFRGHENLLRAEKALEKQELPFLFYGPNLYGEKSKRYSTVHHNEASVAALLAECYASRGFRRVLSLEDGNDITRARVRLLTEALAGSGIACESRSWPELSRQPKNSYLCTTQRHRPTRRNRPVRRRTGRPDRTRFLRCADDSWRRPRPAAARLRPPVPAY